MLSFAHGTPQSTMQGSSDMYRLGMLQSMSHTLRARYCPRLILHYGWTYRISSRCITHTNLVVNKHYVGQKTPNKREKWTLYLASQRTGLLLSCRPLSLPLSVSLHLSAVLPLAGKTLCQYVRPGNSHSGGVFPRLCHWHGLCIRRGKIHSPGLQRRAPGRIPQSRSVRKYTRP